MQRVQDQIARKWHGLRQQMADAAVPARLAARKNELLLAVLLTAFFLTGALSAAHALIGLALVAAWAAWWPAPDSERHAKPRGLLAADDRLWRAVVNAVPEPAIVLGNAGHILHANRMAGDLFGTRRRGGHITTMVRDPELLAAVEQTLATRQSRVVELHARVPVERRLLMMLAPLDHAGLDSAPALLISIRDLTEQDRLARMRADFVANASHELRTPLASLRGFVETLQGAARDDPEARERFLGVMSEQAERMTRLIDDLLSLSRVEMREHLTPAEYVDLNETASHVIQTLQPIAAGAGASIELKELPTPAMIHGDRDEIVQILQNLIQNALKYGKPGGRIGVEVAHEPQGFGRGARFVLSVTDDGPGISPEHLPRLTERFYRVSVAASREKGGTGLGLAIVKHILNRHRGELIIRSKLGHGSTFAAILPAATD
ncbi:MAG TPA: ATP-binding protein [Hyphomicrobiaceae bacterium]|nr:ATP-binding protein [Hyphomicrobiaceae bacterium]